MAGRLAARMRCDRTLVWLAAVNVAVWLTLTLLSAAGRLAGFDGAAAADWLVLPSSLPVLATRPWTLLTYMVTHQSLWHLLFNMLWLIWFGGALLATLSPRHLLCVYVGGGLAGGLSYLLVCGLWPGIGGWLCGASASVLAIMTAAALRTPDMSFNLFLIGEVRLRLIALVCVILAFVGLGGGNSGGEVAHIGGMLYGLVFGLALRRGVDLSRLPRMRRRDAGGRFAARRVARFAGRVDMVRSDRERLDELLDKIRLSGYGSLSRAERRELDRLSGTLRRDV